MIFYIEAHFAVKFIYDFVTAINLSKQACVYLD